MWPIKLLECPMAWRGASRKPEKGTRVEDKCQFLGMAVQHPYFHLGCHVGSLFQAISPKSYDQLLYLVTVMRSLFGGNDITLVEEMDRPAVGSQIHRISGRRSAPSDTAR
jgi:hypothetical protein